MAINAQELFEQKVQQFGMQASNSTFRDDFVKACNRATDEYAHSLDLASEPTHITDTADDTNIDVDANREYIISNGIDYHLVRSGHRSGTLDLAQAKLDWTDSLRIARSDRDHDIATDEGSSTETDAPEEIGNLN